MFICAECVSKHLSKKGKSHHWSLSSGRCEVCNGGNLKKEVKEAAICLDVPSEANWAWKSTSKEGEN